MTDQNHLESGQAVVAQRPTDEDPVLLPEFPDLDAVVENNRSVGRILKLGSPFLLSASDGQIRTLKLKLIS
jgi:hypothetical protein